MSENTEIIEDNEIADYELRELSVKVVENGELCYKLPPLKEIAKYAQNEMQTFWEEYTRIDNPHIYKVDLSDELYQLKTDMIKRIRGEKGWFLAIKN